MRMTLFRRFVAPALVGIVAIGSVIYLLPSDSAEFLYLDASNVGSTCVSRAEWAWLFLTSLLLLVPYVLTAVETKKQTPCVGSSSCLIEDRRYCTRSLVFHPFVIFVALNLAWFVAAVANSNFVKDGQQTIWTWIDVLGAKAAWPALWNLALVLFPVQRTSRMLQQFGVSHRHVTLSWHVWTGQAAILWMWVHTVLLSVSYVGQNGGSIENIWFPKDDRYSEAILNGAGLIALFAASLLWLTSLPAFRRKWFEQFWAMHICCGTVTVAFSALHDYATFFFVLPGFIGYAHDCFLRRYSRHHLSQVPQSDSDIGLWDHSQLSITVHQDPACSIVSVTFPETIADEVAQDPGTILEVSRMIYLKELSASSWQLHPFSVAVVDSKSFTVYIKSLGDWTSCLVDSLKKRASIEQESGGILFLESAQSQDGRAFSRNQGSSTSPLHFQIEGAYRATPTGAVQPETHAIFLAGGVGLTGVSHQALSLHRRGIPVTLIWYTRTQSEADFFCRTLLRRFSSDTQPDPNSGLSSTLVKVYITKPQDQSLENGERDQSVIWTTPIPMAHHARSLFGSQYGDSLCMAVAIVGAILGFFLARQVSCNRWYPGESHVEKHLHQCSVLGFGAEACLMCGIDDDDDGPFPCCRASTCFLGFRGIPIQMVLILPLTFLVGFAQVRRWLLWATRRSYDAVPSSGGRMPLQQSHSAVVGNPPENVVIRHDKPDVPKVLDEAIRGPATITVCGPESLVDAATNHCSRNHPNARIVVQDG